MIRNDYVLVYLNALRWIILQLILLHLINLGWFVDSTCLLQGTPRRLLLWMPVAPPSPLPKVYLCVKVLLLSHVSLLL